MNQNPVLIEALVRDRVAELRRTADADALPRQRQRGYRMIGRARRGTGWWLVGMGLRLAVPRGALNPPASRG